MYIAAVVKQGYTVGEMGKGAFNKPADDQQSMQGNGCCRLGDVRKKRTKGNIIRRLMNYARQSWSYADYSSDMFQETMVHEAEVLLGLLKRRKAALPIKNDEK